MKNKKGFTLIELLAVIIILSVLALIVGVIIGNVIDHARKETYKESVRNIIKSGENYIVKYELVNNIPVIYPVSFACDGSVCTDGVSNLEFTGEVPKSGSILIEDAKTIRANYLSNGRYCASGTKEDLQVAKTCSDIDVDMPRISGELEGRIIKLTLLDNESGIGAYCINTANSKDSCTWINHTNSYAEYTLTEAGTYYAFARDKKGNVSDSIEFVAPATAFCSYEEGHEFDTITTVGITEFAVPCNGLYKLEVWGARGGGISSCGGGGAGAGGYSSGYVYLNVGTTLYVACGGVGNFAAAGGYNGGGAGSHEVDCWGGGSGGGATHIAKVTGSLAEIGYESFVTSGNGLIVAGGGGGASANADSSSLHGGSGGGVNGGNANAGAAGGNQTTGYSFGQGQAGSSVSAWNGGGGGGLYGGYSSVRRRGGGGGSGWIGGVPEIEYKGTTYSPSTSNGGNGGNGYAKITLIAY